MRRKLLTTLLMFFVAIATQAEDTTQRLVVWQKSGEKVYFDIAKLPETFFENGLLVIKCEGEAAVQFQLDNILRYTFEGVNTAIDLMPNERSVSISRTGDAVTISNLPEGSAVQIYAANGMLVETQKSQNGKPLTLSVGQRPSGVYLVKCGCETIKLMKR